MAGFENFGTGLSRGLQFAFQARKEQIAQKTAEAQKRLKTGQALSEGVRKYSGAPLKNFINLMASASEMDPRDPLFQNFVQFAGSLEEQDKGLLADAIDRGYAGGGDLASLYAQFKEDPGGTLKGIAEFEAQQAEEQRAAGFVQQAQGEQAPPTQGVPDSGQFFEASARAAASGDFDAAQKLREQAKGMVPELQTQSAKILSDIQTLEQRFGVKSGPAVSALKRELATQGRAPVNDFAQLLDQRARAYEIYGADSEEARLMDEQVRLAQNQIPSGQLDDEQALRGQYLTTVRSMGTDQVASNFETIKAFANDPSALGDVGLVFGYMKILDPISVVREGEQIIVRSARAFSDELNALAERVSSGQTLTAKQRADLVKRANEAYQAKLRLHNATTNQFQGIAKSAGLDPNRIIVDFTKNVQPFTKAEIADIVKRAQQEEEPQTNPAPTREQQNDQNTLLRELGGGA